MTKPYRAMLRHVGTRTTVFLNLPEDLAENSTVTITEFHAGRPHLEGNVRTVEIPVSLVAGLICKLREIVQLVRTTEGKEGDSQHAIADARVPHSSRASRT